MNPRAVAGKLYRRTLSSGHYLRPGRAVIKATISEQNVQIVYLDQNKWIRLAKAWKNPRNNIEVAQICAKLCDAVANGTICLPLTATNI